MSEAVILEKLEQLTGEIRTMKAEIQDLKTELKQRDGQAKPEAGSLEPLNDLDGEKLKEVCTTLLASVEDLQGMSTTFKAGVELTEDLVPVAQQIYPKVIKYFNELEGEFKLEDLVVLLRKAITSLDAMGEGVDMLKAGIELRDDLMPVIQLAYPQIMKALAVLDQGGFKAEKIIDLLYTVLLNINALTDLLNMATPVTELIQEVNSLLQQTDILPNVNKWLHSLQMGNPAVLMATKTFETIKGIELNEDRVNQLFDALDSIDITNVEPVTPFGMIGQLRDPKVQEALGFIFMLLHAVGGCLQAWDRTGSSRTQANN